MGIFHPREFEQVQSFRSGKMQGRRNACQRRRRTGDIPALFEPRIPGCADTADLGGLFPPQPFCPAASW